MTDFFFFAFKSQIYMCDAKKCFVFGRSWVASFKQMTEIVTLIQTECTQIVLTRYDYCMNNLTLNCALNLKITFLILASIRNLRMKYNVIDKFHIDFFIPYKITNSY